MFSNDERKEILGIARESLETAFSHRNLLIPEMDIKRGAFVTLRKKGNLRGCIGYLEGVKPLFQEIADLARAAAFDDFRFPPLKEEELPMITIEISILSSPEAIERPEDFIPVRDGIIMSLHGRRAVFLPQVAEETGWSRDEMLSALSQKAGLPDNAWKDPSASFWTFQAEVFSEDDL